MKGTWDSEGDRHYALDDYYPSPPKWRWPGSRPLIQLALSLLLLVAVNVLFLMESPAAVKVQQGLSHLVSSREADWTPAIQAMVRSGLWLDSFDRGAYEATRAIKVESQPAMSIPVSGNFSRPFGWELVEGKKLLHAGIDIAAPANAPVRAALGGKVIETGQDPNLGRIVKIDHGKGLISIYGNVSEILVEAGQEVSQAEIIAKMGRSAQAAVFHFEVRDNGQPVDPLSRLTGEDKI